MGASVSTSPLVLGLIILTVIAIFWWRKGKGGVLDAAGNLTQYLALIVSIFAYVATLQQSKILDDQLALQRGEAEFRATRTPGWTVRLEQLTGPTYLPPYLSLIPFFQQTADRPPLRGEAVALNPKEYFHKNDSEPYIEIPMVDERVCSSQPTIKCKETPLLRVTIEFERYGKTYRVPVYLSGGPRR